MDLRQALRIFFKFRRGLLGDLCRCAARSLAVYFEALTGKDLVPGIIAAVQTFGGRINFHPHLHFLVTEGGANRAGIFHRIPRLDDGRLAEAFAREVLRLLVDRGLLSPEWVERAAVLERGGACLGLTAFAAVRADNPSSGAPALRILSS